MNSNKQKFVSVVMATYNGKMYFAEQLSSIIAELLPDDELIIVDDCSSDGTIDLLKTLDYPLVRVVYNIDNSGVLATFERGLLLSTREFVFLCDQDDVWLPGKRAAIVGAFEECPGTLAVVSDVQLIDATGLVTAQSFMATRGGFRGGLMSTLARNRYLGCAMAVRRELLFAALPIPRSVPMHDMWLGALASVLGKVHYIPYPLVQYRRHGGNASPSRRQGLTQMVRWRLSLTFALVRRFLQLKLRRHTVSIASNSIGNP